MMTIEEFHDRLAPRYGPLDAARLLRRCLLGRGRMFGVCRLLQREGMTIRREELQECVRRFRYHYQGKQIKVGR